MKVVQINCSSFGSTGNIARAIHKELLQRGDESYIFYGIGKTIEKNMFRVGNDLSLHSHSVLSRNLGKQGYFSYMSTQKMISKIKGINPDIVHLHNLHGSYLNLPLLFKCLKKSGKRVIITLHDCWLFTGKCPHFTVANCYRWKDSCGGCVQLSTYPRSKIDTTEKCLRDKKEWLSGFGDRLKIITVSNWLRDTAKQSFLSQYPIETIYNGINTDIFRPVDGTRAREKYNIQDKYVILGVSSNWNAQKGLGEFLELSQKLSENEIIVLVGLTEEQIKEMPKNIVGIARTESQAELAELYSAADVFLNTSKEETFGLVTAEAMACGTPVIVYDSTACAEIIGDNDIKLTVGSDVDDVKRSIDEIRQRNIKAENVEMRFNVEKMVKDYVREYKEIIR